MCGPYTPQLTWAAVTMPSREMDLGHNECHYCALFIRTQAESVCRDLPVAQECAAAGRRGWSYG